MAVVNLSAGLVITSWPERRTDLEMVTHWGRQWLVAGSDLYADHGEMPDYPPHAIAALSPLSLVPPEWAVRVWALLNLCLAVFAPCLAVYIVRPGAAWSTAALPILMFLCWGGFRTLLQFSLVTLVCGLLTMKLAGRHPAWSGVCLGLALMKPQMAAPFLFWAVFTRRWRVGAIGTAVVIAGFALWCARTGANPVAVVQAYLEILHTFYLADGEPMMVGLAQLRPMLGVTDAAVIAIDAGLLMLAALLGFPEGKRREPLMIAAPPLVGVWSLMTFYHMTYGFVLLLPVATLLLFENDPHTRAFRRALFWTLQLALMVDVPGMWVRFAPPLLQGQAGELGVLPMHADRILAAALFACLLVLAFQRRRARKSA